MAVALALACCATAFAANDSDESADTTVEESTGDGGGGVIGALLSGESLLEIFKSLFTSTINDFIAGIVNAAIGFVDERMLNLLTKVFHAEEFVNSAGSTVLTMQSLRDVYTFIYAFSCALVTLKFIFKGFQIYILWRGGDADASPRDMAVGAIEAAIVMVAFPWLYERAVDICTYLADGIMGRLGVEGYSVGLGDLRNYVASLTGALLSWAEALLTLIPLLIFIILLFVLWIKLMRQGFELLVMRLGVPLATLGLIDSDMALFKNYFQTLIKTGLTVIIQIALMALSLRVILICQFENILAAIALMATALATPHLMQQFLAPQSVGGGALQKAYSVAMVAHMGKMLFV